MSVHSPACDKEIFKTTPSAMRVIWKKSYEQAILLARVVVVKFLSHLIATVSTGRKVCASA
jgi:hypothetical protein